MVKELLGILGILILLVALYRYLQKYWLRRLLEKKKEALLFALTAHFGKGETVEGGKQVWVLLHDCLYSQVISFARKRSIHGGEKPWKSNSEYWLETLPDSPAGF